MGDGLLIGFASLDEPTSGCSFTTSHTFLQAGDRLQRLSNEKDRLVDLYLHEDIDRATFRERKEGIEAEVIDLEAKMGDQTARIQETRKIISVALKLARDCYTSYRKTSPETKKLWNQAFFAEIVIEDKKVARVTFQEPFEALLRSRGSNKELLVGPTVQNPKNPPLLVATPFGLTKRHGKLRREGYRK